MNIKEVCEEYNISEDTLRYYEKVGVIPPVHRTKGGIRDFNEEDLKWVNQAVCFRNAGLSIEALVEYRRLFELGDSTIPERLELLRKEKENILVSKKKLEDALKRLDYKISRYEEASVTGILDWEKK